MDLTQIFQQFGKTESILILIWLIIAFLVGFLVEYFLVQRLQRRLQEELEEKDLSIQHLEKTLAKSQEELTLKEADLKRANFQVEELQTALQRQEEERRRAQVGLQEARMETEKLQSTNQHYLATIEDLNDQILGLKTRANPFSAEGASMGNTGPGPDRLASIETKLEQLMQENTTLRQELIVHQKNALAAAAETAEATAMIDQEQHKGGAKLFVPTSTTAPLEPTLAPMEQPLTQTQDRFPTWRGGQRDDLTQIEGIGPFLEKKLNAINIFTFAQIATWDAATIAQVTRDIQFFEGRIQKDDWVGQAQRLAEQKQQGLTPSLGKAAATVPAFVPPAIEISSALPGDAADLFATNPVTTDDLTQITGIDPATADILRAAGLQSYAELAKMEPATLRQLLQQYGGNANLDPASWPAQARLALNGEWEVLRDYQETLRNNRS